MANFTEKVYTWLKIGIIIVGAIAAFQFFKSCQEEDPIKRTIITPLKTHTPTPEEKKIVPKGHKAIGTLKPVIVPETKRWEKSETAIVVSVPADGSCNTCTAFTQKTDVKRFVGFSFQPKMFVGWNNHGITGGIHKRSFAGGKQR